MSLDQKVIIHQSSFGSIEIKTIKNIYVKKDTKCILFKIKQLQGSQNQLFSDIINFYNELYDKKIHYVQIYDFTEVQSNSIIDDLTFAKQYANFLQENAEHLLEKCCIKTSVIVKSDIIKNLVNTTLYFYRNVKPTQVFSSYSEAYKWFGEN